MNVPFLDLKTQYQTLKDEIHEAVSEVMDNCAFAGGPFVREFEQAFAQFCNCRACIGVGNGTEALWLSLLALGVGPGDEVITVPNTFIATAEAISFCGATPVFVDIEEQTYNMDPHLLENAITEKTKAVIPVHMYGQMADMAPIMAIAEKYGLFVVEDACQAHGAEYMDSRAGSIGDAGCFSFYPGKNLGAYGEAGAVVTNNPDLAEKISHLRDHGQSEKYIHEVIGWNARMDGIQGAILNVKLKYLPQWNALRRKHAETYHAQLQDLDEIILPVEAGQRKHIYHVFAIRNADRPDFMESIQTSGIQCGIHYPLPVHRQGAYRHLDIEPGRFPVAENLAEEVVSLPMYPEMTTSMVQTVCNAIREWCANGNNRGELNRIIGLRTP